MRRTFFLLTALLCLTLSIIFPAFAEDATDWKLNFFEDFNDNSFGWPLGSQTQGSMAVSQSIQDGSYHWEITTADPNLYYLSLGIAGDPADVRYRFSTEITLPEFTPLACGGLLLDGQENSFYAYMVCSDGTYTLLQSANGTTETLIPYTAVTDFDNFSASEISAEFKNGWVDLYYGETCLDTYNLPYRGGTFGLIAAPESSDKTDFTFGSLAFQSSAIEDENAFNAGSLDPNAPDSITRTLKMLNMKERIASSAGTWSALPDLTMDLAMMGYAKRQPLDLNADNLLIQADIQWASGYDHPDYVNAGCGFYLRGLDESSYIEVYAAMDGVIYVNAYRYGAKVEVITLKYDAWSLEGSGTLAVAADGYNITVLWNDAILGTVTDPVSNGATGSAGYLVHSGTNGDFGTRCVFSQGNAYTFSAEQ